MPVVSVRIPQIGEGLQEARLVGVLKQPGDTVKRDEPIYQMETDKAVMDVESPYEGKIVRWLAEVDSILAIGAAVAEMEVSEGTKEMEVHGAAAHAEPAAAQATQAASATASAGLRGANIPPRTRAYAKEKGISDEVLASIASAGGKLMPSDIDAFLANGSAVHPPSDSADTPSTGAGVGGTYTQQPFSAKQRLVASRLQRGNQLAVPGTIVVTADWGPIEHLKSRMKSLGGSFQPSSFTIFAYAVVKALAEFPAFRSTLRGDDTVRTYDHVNLGIAVALPGDELVTAVVEGADTMDFETFAARCREQIELARNGQDQANESVTVSLTNMQSFGLRDAVPVVVPPAVATLFLGEVFNGLAQDVSELQIQRQVNLSLTFDHRLINGVGAAEFINKVKSNVETISRYVIVG